MDGHPLRDTSRRRVLLGTAAAAGVGLAGCLGSSDRPAPISLDEPLSCDQCGMVINQQPGPSGQTYYRDNSPEGHDPPARFCSTVCTFRHRFATESRGWRPRVTYLTDYAVVDYRVRQEGGAQVVSAHLAADHFAATEGLDVVVGSEVEGAMGPAIVPFGDGDAAAEFASTYGGDVIAAEDVSRQLVAQG
ncbi:nitrous oxide reductase accessory protein NosL [Haloplanus salinus]|jgi:nitrous oxide reductase accessory protein NosL|uniref:Nitrous oxide reductase accessory protein NosL n=1 Tax=Haloplanus salinus TaxID=1126245 RepID=A0A368ND09_9EURY|nr:nitrous oxide reductase accessory protein NosL [Haloplanus salinus]RCU48452.1 nitrous oxide reductase accessory protein NosL [Haloplanus salinus]